MPLPKDYPIESFDPRLPAILLRGARGEDFTIRCRTAAEAHRLQHMLHSYRHRARKQYGDAATEKWLPLYTAVVGITKDEHGKKTLLHIYSRHAEFDDLLNTIVTASPDLPADPLAEFDPQPAGKPEGSGGG